MRKVIIEPVCLKYLSLDRFTGKKMKTNQDSASDGVFAIPDEW